MIQKKEKFIKIGCIVADILLLAAIVFSLISAYFFTTKVDFIVEYAMSDDIEGQNARLFYKSPSENYNDEDSSIGEIKSSEAILTVDVNLAGKGLRFDPTDAPSDVKISSISVLKSGKEIMTLTGGQIYKYIDSASNCEYKKTGNTLIIRNNTDDPQIYFTSEFVEEVSDAVLREEFVKFYAILAIYIIFALFQIYTFVICQDKILCTRDAQNANRHTDSKDVECPDENGSQHVADKNVEWYIDSENPNQSSDNVEISSITTNIEDKTVKSTETTGTIEATETIKAIDVEETSDGLEVERTEKTAKVAKYAETSESEINSKTRIFTVLRWIGFGLGIIITSVVLILAYAANYGITYFEENFANVAIGQIIYHLNVPLEGTDVSSYSDVIDQIINVSITILILMIVVNVLIRFWFKRSTVMTNFLISLCGAAFVAKALVAAVYEFGVVDYFKYISQDTKLYDDYYVDGRDVAITFPKEKRNLIYIVLESMEISYADGESGGGMDVNLIPELTELAFANEQFGTRDELNGANDIPGATFTMGSLVAQTSGVPINEGLIANSTLNGTWESENNYLPGVWTIGDVLNEEGYNQEFIIGSNGDFAGRSSYFKGHGNYEIFDYDTAVERKYFSSDYHVWWGYEDKKLIEYAKIELEDMASNDEPFNLTMLTVDTHFVGGYVCEDCGTEYENQYSNVIACSNRQISEFVAWIQEQDFYENTTIVIAGDHPTMDSGYVDDNIDSSFTRKTYFTIINSAIENENEGTVRDYTTIDFYPTTLAALGVDIEGDRLGLGVNLYSDIPTLIEEYGDEYLQTEFLKDSSLYRKKLMYGK